jgi:hypothetical protein
MARYRYGISIDFRYLVGQGAGRVALKQREAWHGDPDYRSNTRPLVTSE